MRQVEPNDAHCCSPERVHTWKVLVTLQRHTRRSIHHVSGVTEIKKEVGTAQRVSREQEEPQARADKQQRDRAREGVSPPPNQVRRFRVRQRPTRWPSPFDLQLRQCFAELIDPLIGNQKTLDEIELFKLLQVAELDEPNVRNFPDCPDVQ